jgi:tetratricopeptide (TPR) repeat protein
MEKDYGPFFVIHYKMFRMKTISKRRILILIFFIPVLLQPLFSQDIVTANDFNAGGDDRGKLLSTYREFFKWKEYDNAQESWTVLFREYPDASEKLYVDGVTMYRHYIEKATDGAVRENKIDTLMLIYDQRMEFFGGEGNVLGRKGNDLLRYRSSDMDQVEAAYGMLGASLEIQGTKSRESVMLSYISAGLLLYHEEMIDKAKLLEDYFLVNGLLDQLDGSSSRWKKTRASVDEMILGEDILTCVGLDLYFATRYDRNSEDPELLENMVKYYSNAGCRQSDLYMAAAVKLFDEDPNSESAHELALLFVGKDDLDNATWYLRLAVVDEALDDETRAAWFYELSVVCLANGEHDEAINYAREALAYKDDYGKAYMALGDAFISARKQLGDEFQQQSVYWAAADMYQAAARMDPDLVEESGEKLALCKANYPSNEDIFFQDLTEGNSYQLGGSIKANTTVRARD